MHLNLDKTAKPNISLRFSMKAYLSLSESIFISMKGEIFS